VRSFKRVTYMINASSPKISSDYHEIAMSDSESDIAIPDSSVIEQTLRAIVARLYKAGDHEELTVKRVRKATESKLKLPDDFLKENSAWKAKSKNIIADEHVGIVI
jgi:hypothetical protein